MKMRLHFPLPRVLTLLLLLHYFCFFSCCASDDYKTLLQIKASFRGSILLDWNKQNSSGFCNWKGISCNSAGRVISLNISAKAYCFVEDQYIAGCRLEGPFFRGIFQLTKLRVLSLPFHLISGAIPDEISNLKFLEVLELQENNLTGSLPLGFRHLSLLRVLNAAGNGLYGEIPEALTRCTRLEILLLSNNFLNGTLPVSLGNLESLEVLGLGFNQFIGEIPKSLGGCSCLEHLWLAGNLLTGNIPSNLGHCVRLRSILLFSNILEGNIPLELRRLEFLEVLDVSRNSLTGVIPTELGQCKSLKVLVLTNLWDFSPSKVLFNDSNEDVLSSNVKGEFNFFEGGVPDSLTSLPRIRIIWAPRTNLSSPLSSNWGDCNELQLINLGHNYISGAIPFQLEKCKNLILLDFSSNDLNGSIPQHLPVSCMVYFNVSSNSLSGSVQNFGKANCSGSRSFSFTRSQVSTSQLDMVDIEQAPNLNNIYLNLFVWNTVENSPLTDNGSENMKVFHDLSYNDFDGQMPPLLIGSELFAIQPAYGYFLNDNKFSQSTKEFFVPCEKLQSLTLNLSANHISTSLDSLGLTTCSSLRHLEAASNRITGLVPEDIGNMIGLVYLDLGSNLLKGAIPRQIGQLEKLQVLHLPKNNLSGAIPSDIGRLSSLVVLDLSSNELTGDIPEDLAKLSHLRILHLGFNKLSGQVPKGFQNLSDLTILDISFNNLSGTLPTLRNSSSCDNVRGNTYLEPCLSASMVEASSPTHAPFPYASLPLGRNGKGWGHLNKVEIAAITSSSAIVILVAVIVVFSLLGKRRLVRFPSIRYGGRDVVTFTNVDIPLTYETVVRATGNFSLRNLIGNGGFGATYKAEISPGSLLAVKRLSIGRFQGIQQFETEIRTLGRIRHQHLVTLIGYYASESEMFLIYNYLSGGNLERFIHERSRRNVHWPTLHKIALHVAEALSYLHNSCVPRVLHRDIKPSNILLDNSLNAYLSDFGLARLLEVSETHATTDVAGTFGYVAPEYALTCRVSDKSDVYSYGVVLLELLSGKKSLDPSFSCYGNGFNIVAWASMLLEAQREHEVFPHDLWHSAPHEDLIKLLQLAVKCTLEVLSARPSMKEVVQELKTLATPSRASS